MPALTTSQLIKILLGIFVVVVVIVGVFLFFRNTVIDFIKNLPGQEESSDGQIEEGSQVGQEDEEEKFEEEIDCEASGCTEKPPEDLKCSLNLIKAETKVRGYLYKCTRKGECIKTIWRKEVKKCKYGCTDGECRGCLRSGTIVYFFYSETEPSYDWCCDGYYCSKKGFLGICLEHKCK